MEQQEQIQKKQKPQKNDVLHRLGLLFVLFCLLIVAMIVVLGQGQNSNQLCGTSANGAYNYQQATYTIGVAAKNYRAHYNNGKGTTANFGGAAITLCPVQGKEYTKYSPILKGYEYPGDDAPENATHSEQQAYHWVISKLALAQFQAGSHMYVTIYSEVPVCQQCKIDMQAWNSDFQALLNGTVVQTQIWQMRRGSPVAVGRNPVPDNKKTLGFVPRDFPAGTGFPLQYGDVEIVP